MSSEVEAIGAAATAGLAAAALERPEARSAGAGACANCSAQLAGNYCAKCGQPARVHRTLVHMAGEFLRGLMHFDTRAWRTLPMLVLRPGTLTHNYIHGRRARYISPLAMFLLAVFAMFVVFGLTGGPRIGVPEPDSRIGELSQSVGDAEEKLAAARKQASDLSAAGADSGALEAAQLKAEVARVELDAFRAGLAIAEQSKDGPLEVARVTTESEPSSKSNEGSIYDQIREAAQEEGFRIDTGWPTLDERLQEAALNPELAVYKIQNAAYEAAYLLVPISLPLIWLMFAWRRGTTLFDHSVYILYSLSFVSLLFIAVSLLWMIPGAMTWLWVPFLLAAPGHSFFHMKGGYGLSWFSALWRLPFQLLFAGIGMLVYLIVILALGLAG